MKKIRDLNNIFTATTPEDFRLEYISDFNSGKAVTEVFKRIEKELGRKLNVVFSLTGKVRNGELAVPFYKNAIEEIKRKNLFNLIVVGVSDINTSDNNPYNEKNVLDQSEISRKWLTEDEAITRFKEEINFDYFKIIDGPPISYINEEYHKKGRLREHVFYRFQQQFIKFDESIKLVTEPVDIIFKTRWDLVFNPELFVDYFINNVLFTMIYMSKNRSYNGSNDIAVTLSDSPYYINNLEYNKGDLNVTMRDWNFFCSGAAYRSFSENLSEAIYYGIGEANLKFKEMFGFDCNFRAHRSGYVWLYGLVLAAGEDAMKAGTLLPRQLAYIMIPFKKLLRGDHPIYHDPRWQDDGSLFSFYYLEGRNLGR